MATPSTDAPVSPLRQRMQYDMLMRGLADAIAARGGRFIRGEARLIGGGSRVAVALDETMLHPDRVVVAGGAWSAELAAQIGERIRLETERGYHVEFATERSLLHSPTCYPSAGFYMVPLSHGLRAAGTVELGGLDKPFRNVRAAVIERTARFFLPALGHKTSDWLGFRPSMPDSIPVIGKSITRPDVVYAFGHGHIGLTLAGITGRIVCDLVNGDTPPIDPGPLRPNRY
ncbi:FAD-binding oxidoreductase (plasmid) [Aminobacter sp. NyZ550]|uniref:NAD(P)/FAD-dependent oxidoreductase n=1 Tax=unclassified Aminobacter TaxID=2644704 RepID=UPI0021D5EE81|nr:FAD-binding oxidoreductase [Aminobacter sp. NyZ550]WAX98725.1 FAD-binding oxidoreductase [Aminobacter sp. NyZ550]